MALQILSDHEFSTTMLFYSVLSIPLKMNINISLRGLDTIQNHIPPVLQRLSSNNANLLFSPPKHLLAFFAHVVLSPLPLLCDESLRFLPDLVQISLSPGSSACSQFHYSILRLPFPLIFISNVWNSNLRAGIKIYLCPVSLGILGRTHYRALILSQLSLALSSCVLPTSCNFSLLFLPPGPHWHSLQSTTDTGCPV